MSGQPGRRGGAWGVAFGGVVLSVVSSVIVTSLQTDPKIGSREATQFLQAYYRDVTDPARTREVYETRTSDVFRSFAQRDVDSAVADYATTDRIDVRRVVRIDGFGGTAYFVRLTFVPKKGKPSTEDFTFYLSCDNHWASLPKITCQPSDLKIETVEPNATKAPARAGT